jgi:hypothetical protein
MDKRLMDTLGWGVVLWLIGYILGIALFFVLPPSILGWAIMPVGIAVTLFVLFKKIDGNSLGYYIPIAVAWTVIAVFLDYIFIVKLLNPADGYYRLDVYIYYALTFIMPIAAGFWKNRKVHAN